MLNLRLYLHHLSRKIKIFNFLINKIDNSNLNYLNKTYKNICKNKIKFITNIDKYYLLIQYINNDYKLQIKFYNIIKLLIPNYNLCFLKDLIAVNYMSKQYYGTQTIKDENYLKFYPILGIAKKHDNLINDNKLNLINNRREKFSLGYIEDYIRILSDKSNCIVSMDIYIK